MSTKESLNTPDATSAPNEPDPWDSLTNGAERASNEEDDPISLYDEKGTIRFEAPEVCWNDGWSVGKPPSGEMYGSLMPDYMPPETPRPPIEADVPSPDSPEPAPNTEQEREGDINAEQEQEREGDSNDEQESAAADQNDGSAGGIGIEDNDSTNNDDDPSQY